MKTGLLQAHARRDRDLGLDARCNEAPPVLEMAHGPPTPLAAAVRARVARYQDGIPMLVHQAAQAVALATGKKPPPEPLLRAARRC